MSEGTQSAALYAAGDTQVTAGKIQVGTGAVNTALGVVQLVQSSGHSKDASTLSQRTKDLQVENLNRTNLNPVMEKNRLSMAISGPRRKSRSPPE